MSRFFNKKYASLVPYTPGEQPQDKRRYIKLNTNESPFPPSPSAQRLVMEAAQDSQLYPDPEYRALVRAASDRLGTAHDEIIFTNGSDEILNFAFMAFCDDGRPAVFPNITYGFYSVFADLNGVPYEAVPLSEDFTVRIEDYIGINKTVFLANPNAPTGIALKRGDLERIIASNPDSVIVIDEAYVDFGAESVLPLIHKYDNLLVCRTFSKSHSLAGGRLGFGAGCAELIRDINTIKYSTNPYNISRMTAAAGIGAIEDEEYFEENRRKIIAERGRTADRLKKMGFVMTESLANFLFIKHPDIGGMELYRALKEKGVLIRHFETELLRDYNRVTIGSAVQMEEFAERVAEILEERR